MCVFVVVVIFMFFFIFLFCFSGSLMSLLCIFFQDVSRNTYVIEAVGFSDLLVILGNLQKT